MITALGSLRAPAAEDEETIPVAKVRTLLEVGRPLVSLDAPLGADETATLADFHEDSRAETLLENDARARLYRMLDRLTPRERDRARDIVRARFGLGDDEPQTLDEIGIRYALTRERIRQIEVRALTKLASPDSSSRSPATDTHDRARPSVCCR